MVNPRMRRLAGGLVAACGIVLSSFAVGLGGASAVPPGIPDQEDPLGGEASTTSTVRMRERCIWYVDGVPATINLLPTGDDVAGEDSDGDPIGKVYDGSDGGMKLFDTLSVIGREASAPSTDPLAADAEGLKGVRRWPVTVSYFDGAKPDGEPNYVLGFDLYENGVSGALNINYGNYALTGRLSKFELLPQKACIR